MTERTIAGWAVVEGDLIRIRTVSDTQRAAMVNWLVAERGIYVHANMGDHAIELLFHRHKFDARVEAVTVARSFGEKDKNR